MSKSRDTPRSSRLRAERRVDDSLVSRRQHELNDDVACPTTVSSRRRVIRLYCITRQFVLQRCVTSL